MARTHCFLLQSQCEFCLQTGFEPLLFSRCSSVNGTLNFKLAAFNSVLAVELGREAVKHRISWLVTLTTHLTNSILLTPPVKTIWSQEYSFHHPSWQTFEFPLRVMLHTQKRLSNRNSNSLILHNDTGLEITSYFNLLQSMVRKSKRRVQRIRNSR